MFDRFREAVYTDLPIVPEMVAIRIGLALVLGFVVAGVFRISQPRRRNDVQAMSTTLVLLSVLIALVTIVIGDNVARAFGLVGSLSIVRFRTVVEDTRDTAFVIFAVVIGMSVGAGYTLLAVIGIPAITLAALLMKIVYRKRGQGGSATLVVRVGLGQNPQTLLSELMGKYLNHAQLVVITTAKQGSALELNYQIQLCRMEDALAVVAQLNRMEGVHNVEFRPV